MKFHMARLIAVLLLLVFSASTALAQSVADQEACIQAVQSSNDAFSASDWQSHINLKKQELETCWWDKDPSNTANAYASIGVAYYKLGEFNYSKSSFLKCTQLYYSEPDCHYWLAAISLEQNDFDSFVKEKEIARKIALRIISEGIPSYTTDKIMIMRFRGRINRAKIVLQKIAQF